VGALHEFFINEGLLNIDRVQMCIITDPLAHDIEHVPTISYKGQTYFTTHSMIYSKFLACHNKRVKGVFIDSPNIRLELESPERRQRGKYLVDFSQFDVEVRRDRAPTIDEYLNDVEGVKKILNGDMERAIDLFERMIVHCFARINDRCGDALKELGVELPVPKKPFPKFRYDEALKRFGKHDMEKGIGTVTDAPVFWVIGIPRENYDLIYPYIKADGSKVSMKDVDSTMVYNYDLCARGVRRDTGELTEPREILSGAVREWLFGPIVERMLDNGVIPERPKIVSGNIENIGRLGGYGPFLLVASQEDAQGHPLFPATYGGGIGIERTLYAICRGMAVDRIEQVTLFGKNPDSQQIYLF
jgi:aspartyl/asparaginyl-tRNA synthetase